MTIEDNKLENDISMIEEERSNGGVFGVSDYAANTALLTQVAYSSAQNVKNSSLPLVNVSETQAVPTDPWAVSGGAAQWHLVGAHGLNTIPVWNDYTGEGVIVAVMDDGFNYNHSELTANYRTDLDEDVLNNDNDALNDSGDNHGTHVSLVIAADDNGVHGTGVAFDSDVFGVKRGFNGEGTIDEIVTGFEHVLTQGADIMNNSWGISAPFGDNKKIDFIGTDTADVVDQFQNLVENGRDGLGINIVFSAGNSRVQGSSSNYKNYQNSPYTITVGAIEQDGTFAYFSEAGANLLVTAPGDSIRVSTASDNGGASFISGTSFSAPAVSGVISLMLEANSELGYRDVQEILALSGRQVDADGIGWANEGWQINGANNFNGGGMHFSHDYGYGNVDALTAVRLAESWGEQNTFSNLSVIDPVSVAPALTIPEQGTITSTITITEDISIEHILIDLDIDHEKAGDLVVTLTSPDGTDSVLMHHVSNGAFTSAYGIYNGVNFEFSSVAHWGESSLGDWTLTVADETAGNAGTLNNWSVSFLGSEHSEDDTYFFTDDYAGSTILSDSAGINSLNLTALTGNALINLRSGFGTTNAEVGIAHERHTFNIAEGTIITNILSGDGDDLLLGNEANNEIYGGRGNDYIYGGHLGDDLLDGQDGFDRALFDLDITEYLINIVDSATIILSDLAQSFTDTLLNFEMFQFDNTVYTRDAVETFVAAGGGQGVDFVNTRIIVDNGYSPQRFDQQSLGSYAYTDAMLGGDFDHDSFYVERTTTGFELTTGDNPTIYQFTLKNDDLTAVNLERIDVVTLDHSGSINDMGLTLNNVDRGRITTGGGNDSIVIERKNIGDQEASDAWVIDTGAGNDSVEINGPNRDIFFSTIYLGEGNDSAFIAALSNSRIYGGEGDDVVNVYVGTNYVDGGAGDDELTGGSGNDTLIGGDGIDIISSYAGLNRLEGGAGDDWIMGGMNGDRIFGDGDDDQLYGMDGRDVIRGGDGFDTIDGGEGNDQIFGDGGIDFIQGGEGNDFIRGGDEYDQLSGNNGNDKLYGDAGNDFLYGDEGFDALYGGADHDYLFGGAGNDRLYGQSGIDTLDGGDGSDILYAGDGALDTLIGGNGADRLYGSSGQDVFVLNATDGSTDRFYNLTFGQDIINVTDILDGYEEGIDDLNDFVQIVDRGNGTTDLRINADGDAGGAFSSAAIIHTESYGLINVDNLSANGGLVADTSI